MRIITLLFFVTTFYDMSAQYQNPLNSGGITTSGVTWNAEKQEILLQPQNGTAEATTTLIGDFILTAERAAGSTATATGWKVGTASNSSLITASLEADGLLVFRSVNSTITARKKNFNILQLERKGNRFLLRAAHAGEPLQLIAESEIPDAGEVMQTGLFAAAGQTTWFNIRIDRPVPDGYDPEKSGYPSSRMELIDIATRRRTVIHQYAHRFEAPNFMPDGKSLLFNQEGLLYTVPVTGGQAKVFPTGIANRNNNDHGISFDGKWLALSHHRDNMPDGGSTVYIMPLNSTGGTPQLVTAQTPSYWHGWSADGKKVYYVAKRGTVPQYHIYSNTVDGKSETRLTDHATGHVDGPEASPDGKWIYYNGNATGTMQIWRMRPDGSGKEQVTFDENHNWFPHLSPDGKWIAYLAFLPDIHPDEHPAYKHVTLRLMPASGGAPQVIAYLYGGQGTINVPSWSPDSKTIAFVSYTQP